MQMWRCWQGLKAALQHGNISLQRDKSRSHTDVAFFPASPQFWGGIRWYSGISKSINVDTKGIIMSEAATPARRGRGGGGAARRAARTAVSFETAKYIERNIPNFEVLTEEALCIIEANAEQVLEEVGVNFLDNPAALKRWADAGADIDGERVRIPKGLARKLCATAPSTFTQYARNPERNVEIGGRNLVLAPVYGPPFVRDAEGGRRYATIGDFQKFVKLGYMSKWLHHSGGTVCEPTDVPVNKRHLDMLHAHMTLSDKPFMGSVTEPSRAQDSVDMASILFGKDFVQENTVMTSLININSPMTFDDVMMGALEVYAQTNQACIVSPFIVGGAMAPVSVAGTLTQVMAEALAGIAYSQLIRPGAPVIMGAFVTSIDMNSGAPTFGTPEAAHITYGAGQLARRMGLPYRSSGGFTGSKLPDAQAAYETANSLNMGLLAGVNFMLHSCGWLEGGLVSSFEKFVMDADQLGALHHLARGVEIDENAQAMDAIREVGPGGHFLGCAHTQANFKDAFWKSDLLDYKPFETWEDEGARDSQSLASARVEKMLNDYIQPPLDQGIADGLNDYIAKRKEAEPDSFM
jgi:trimethylamine--corrinoid protein Co-methyltransferase